MIEASTRNAVNRIHGVDGILSGGLVFARKPIQKCPAITWFRIVSILYSLQTQNMLTGCESSLPDAITYLLKSEQSHIIFELMLFLVRKSYATRAVRVHNNICIEAC